MRLDVEKKKSATQWSFWLFFSHSHAYSPLFLHLSFFLKSCSLCLFHLIYLVYFAFICLQFQVHLHGLFRIAMSLLCLLILFSSWPMFILFFITSHAACWMFKLLLRVFLQSLKKMLKLMTDILPLLVQNHYTVVYPEVFSHCSAPSPPVSGRYSHQCQQTTDCPWQ